MSEKYFHKIDIVGGWKADKINFLKFKIRYASLLGCLQGMKFMVESLPPGEAKQSLDAVYQKALADVQDEIAEIFGETFNCGHYAEEPTLEWVLEDDYLQLFFPVGQNNEEEKNIKEAR